MKRRRNYSSWEIGGLIGSTVCLMYLVFPHFLISFRIGIFVDGSYNLPNWYTVISIFSIAIGLSLAVRQWFRIYSTYALFCCLILFIALPVIMFHLVNVLGNLNANNMDEHIRYIALRSNILSETITNAVAIILPIGMNRPRWRKVTPSPIEAFE